MSSSPGESFARIAFWQQGIEDDLKLPIPPLGNRIRQIVDEDGPVLTLAQSEGKDRLRMSRLGLKPVDERFVPAFTRFARGAHSRSRITGMVFWPDGSNSRICAGVSTFRDDYPRSGLRCGDDDCSAFVEQRPAAGRDEACAVRQRDFRINFQDLAARQRKRRRLKGKGELIGGGQIMCAGR